MKKEIVREILDSNKSLLFKPSNMDILEYMLQHYIHLSVVDAVKQLKDDNLGSHLSP